MTGIPSSTGKAKRAYIYLACVLFFLLLVGIVLLISRTGDTSQLQQSAQSHPTGGDQIATGNDILSSKDANEALAGVAPSPLVLPEGQGLKLLGGQVPEKATRGAPVLLSYSDGNHNVALTQILGGVESNFYPAADSSDSSLPQPRVKFTINVRGGMSAIYKEAEVRDRVHSELQWQENDWLIVLDADDVDQAYLVALAEKLAPYKP